MAVASLLGYGARLLGKIQKGTAPEDEDNDSGNEDYATDSDAANDADSDPGNGVQEVEGEIAQSPGALTASPDQKPGTQLQPNRLNQSPIPQTLQQLEAARGDPKSLLWDPFAVVAALGYKDNPRPMTYDTLKAVVWRVPILHSVLLTRLRQLANFAVPQTDKYGTGFRVQLRDKKAKRTPASEARSQQIEQFMLTTGVTENPSARDNFTKFLVKYGRDSLTYDQGCYEIVPSKGDEDVPGAFYAVDGRTIRIADTTKLHLDPEDKDVVRYVQVYDGLVVAEYTSRELSFGVRNPSSDIRLQGYGQSEIEMLVEVVTALLWGFGYNMKQFSQGTSAKGIINFKGPVPEKHLRAFREQWYSMLAGIENAFKTPIVNADDMQWIDLGKTNSEMEFSAWFDFLIKIVAAVYGMDPMEINFKYGDTGQKTMFESSNNAKLTASKDKGLKPLLRFIQDDLNAHIVQPLDEDFVLEFVGLDATTQAEQADLLAKQVKVYKTVDEVRAEEDLPPLPDGTGAILLDPVYMQHLTMVQQAQNPPPAPMDEDGNPLDGSGDGDGPPQDAEDNKGEGAGADTSAPPFSGKGSDNPAAAAKPAKPSGPDAQKSMAPRRSGKVILEIEV